MSNHGEQALPTGFMEDVRNSLNSNVFRSNMITASLFIAVFEMLKHSVVDQVKSFFFCEADQEDSLGRTEYKEHVLGLGTKKNVLDASLVWMKRESAISAEDVKIFYNLRETRNRLTHEFPQFTDFGTPLEIFDSLVQMASLLSKIDEWWFWNYEVDLIPAEKRPEEGTEVYSGRLLMARLMVDMTFEATATKGGEVDG